MNADSIILECMTLQWRLNEHQNVSNHRRLHCSGAGQRKHHWPLWGESTGHRCFHLMTSSWKSECRIICRVLCHIYAYLHMDILNGVCYYGRTPHFLSVIIYLSIVSASLVLDAPVVFCMKCVVCITRVFMYWSLYMFCQKWRNEDVQASFQISCIDLTMRLVIRIITKTVTTGAPFY